MKKNILGFSTVYRYTCVTSVENNLNQYIAGIHTKILIACCLATIMSRRIIFLKKYRCH